MKFEGNVLVCEGLSEAEARWVVERYESAQPGLGLRLESPWSFGMLRISGPAFSDFLRGIRYERNIEDHWSELDLDGEFFRGLVAKAERCADREPRLRFYRGWKVSQVESVDTLEPVAELGGRVELVPADEVVTGDWGTFWMLVELSSPDEPWSDLYQIEFAGVHEDAVRARQVERSRVFAGLGRAFGLGYRDVEYSRGIQFIEGWLERGGHPIEEWGTPDGSPDPLVRLLNRVLVGDDPVVLAVSGGWGSAVFEGSGPLAAPELIAGSEFVDEFRFEVEGLRVRVFLDGEDPPRVEVYHRNGPSPLEDGFSARPVEYRVITEGLL